MATRTKALAEVADTIKNGHPPGMESLGTDSADTEPDAPKAPSKPAARKSPAKRSAGRPSNDEKLTEAVAEQLQMVGLAVGTITIVTGDPAYIADSEAIVKHSDDLARALVSASATNKRLRKMLEGGLETAGWIGVLVAVGKLGVDIAGNHTGPRLSVVPTPAPAGPDDPFR